MIVTASEFDELDELDGEDVGLVLWNVAVFVTPVVGFGPAVNDLLEVENRLL